MSVSSDTCEVEEIAMATFIALREMDARCPTGLCDYVSCSPYAGKRRKDEAAMTWGVTDLLGKQWRVEQEEHDYPQGNFSCDRVLQLRDHSRLWLEIKLAWRTWFYVILKHNDMRAYNGYLKGERHSHSVAGDFTKLERIGRGHARYVALLVIGFDGRDGRMEMDVADLVKREKIVDRGWYLLSDSWVTRQSAECWNRCWFAWRDAR